MVVLVAKYHVSPGKGGQVLEALERMTVQVAQNEPGCRLYHANRATDNPDLFLLYEHYEDTAALETHRETPHFKGSPYH